MGSTKHLVTGNYSGKLQSMSYPRRDVGILILIPILVILFVTAVATGTIKIDLPYLNIPLS